MRCPSLRVSRNEMPTWCGGLTSIDKNIFGEAMVRMATLSVVAFAAAFADANAATGDARACDTGEANVEHTNLAAADPGVISSGGIFERDGKQYYFSTFSLGSIDPKVPGGVCIRYEIENFGARDAMGASLGPASATIRSLRAEEIGIDFIDVPYGERLRWLRPQLSNHNELARVNIDFGAFERAHSTAETLVTIETEEHRQPGTQSPPLFPDYPLTLKFPQAKAALAEANIPATPVITITNALAQKQKELLPTAYVLSLGDVTISITSSSFFKGDGYELVTDVRLGAKNRTEYSLFSPGLIGVKLSGGPENIDAILNYLREIRKFWTVPIRLEDGKFSNVSFVPTNASLDSSAPAFFYVRYPITLRTKAVTICVEVSAFSALPVNFDKSYCNN